MSQQNGRFRWGNTVPVILGALLAILGWVYRGVADVPAMVQRVEQVEMRVNDMDRERRQLFERLTVVEVNLRNLVEGQARLERQLDRLIRR